MERFKSAMSSAGSAIKSSPGRMKSGLSSAGQYVGSTIKAAPGNIKDAIEATPGKIKSGGKQLGSSMNQARKKSRDFMRQKREQNMERMREHGKEMREKRGLVRQVMRERGSAMREGMRQNGKAMREGMRQSGKAMRERRGRAQERVQQGRIKMRESTRNMKNMSTPQNARLVAHEQLPPQYEAQLLTAAQTQPSTMGYYNPASYYTVPPKNVTPLQRATKQREKAILYACLIVATVIMFPHIRQDIGFLLLVILTLLMVISIAREQKL